MGKYEVELQDEDDEAECPECDGTGCDFDRQRTNLDIPINHRGHSEYEDCQVCCGFGILNW